MGTRAEGRQRGGGRGGSIRGREEVGVPPRRFMVLAPPDPGETLKSNDRTLNPKPYPFNPKL